MSELTLVTGFLNVGREGNDWNVFKRDSSDYLKSFINGVAKLNCPMVIFIEKCYLDQIANCRNHIPSYKTKFFIIDQSFVEASKAWGIYKTAEQLISLPGYHQMMDEPGRPEVSKAKYLLAMYIKFDMIMRIIKTNPYNTSHFAWIDIGITHGWAPLGNTNSPFFPRSLVKNDDSLHVLQVERLRVEDDNVHNYWRSKKSRIMGGFFCGTAKAYQKATHEIWKTTNFGLHSHGYADDEQTPLTYTSMITGGLVKLHFHDKLTYHWLDCINNINVSQSLDVNTFTSLSNHYQHHLRDIYTKLFHEKSRELIHVKLAAKLTEVGFHPINVELYHLCFILSHLFCDKVVITETGLCSGHFTAIMAHFNRMEGNKTESTVISTENTNIEKTNEFFDYLETKTTFVNLKDKDPNYLKGWVLRHRAPDILFINYYDVMNVSSTSNILETLFHSLLPGGYIVVEITNLQFIRELYMKRKLMFEVGNYVIVKNDEHNFMDV
jgi:hypothetical protein